MFITMMMVVFFASKSLVAKQGVDFFDVIFSVMDGDEVAVKSIDWFIAHPVEAERQIEECLKDSRLQSSKKCRNAGSAYQIYKQINVNNAVS